MAVCATNSSLAERLSDVLVGRRSDLEISRHVYADGVAYLLHHPVTFESHRLSPDDYHVFCHIDGQQTLGVIFQRLVEKNLLSPDREEQFYGFVVRLNAMGLLDLPVSDANQLHERHLKRKAAVRSAGINRYLFLQIPLVSPDRFLTRTMPLVRPVFSRMAAVVWLLSLVATFYVVVTRWPELTSPLGTLAAAENLPLMWVLLLGLKVIHEFGHAWACKNFGGRVPSMGAYMIVLSPCAFVDASASWKFPSRWQRILVSLGGMYFESWMAMLGVLVWSLTEPSLVNSAALMVVVLSTIVTVGFNINPLMKFDGYYALSDLLGLPHLREDASEEWNRLIKRKLFGTSLPPVAKTPSGQIGYACFGGAILVWRILIVIGIGLMFATLLPGIGPMLAIVYAGGALLKWIRSVGSYVRTSEELEGLRLRAGLVSAAAVVTVLAAVSCLPIPGGSRLQGVVVPEHQHTIYSKGVGFLQAVDHRDGDVLAPGEIVCRIQDQQLTARFQQIQLQVQSLEQELVAAIGTDFDTAVQTRKRLKQARQELEEFARRHAHLDVRTPVGGTLSDSRTAIHVGRFVRDGDVLGVVNSGDWQVATSVDENTFARLALCEGDVVQVRLDGQRPVEGRIVRLQKLASPVIRQEQLQQQNGGSIPVMPDSAVAQQPFFEVRIAIPEARRGLRDGHRAFVRFGSPAETIGAELVRRIRRFMGELRVG